MMSEYSSAETLDSRVRATRININQIVTAALLIGAAALMFLQWRSWRTFDWTTFAAETRALKWLPLSTAVFLSLLTFPLRAWRWQIFLSPIRPARFPKSQQRSGATANWTQYRRP